jgi:hypothetical protein
VLCITIMPSSLSTAVLTISYWLVLTIYDRVGTREGSKFCQNFTNYGDGRKKNPKFCIIH